MKKTEDGDTFYEVVHKHENPVASLNYARINCLSQNKEGILPVASDTNVTQLTVLRQRCTFSEAEAYLLMFI